MGESRSSCFCASEPDQPVRFLFFPLSLSTRGGLGNFALPGKRYTSHSLRIISLHKHKVFVYVVLGVWPGALLNFTSPVTFFLSFSSFSSGVPQKYIIQILNLASLALIFKYCFGNYEHLFSLPKEDWCHLFSATLEFIFTTAKWEEANHNE